MPIPHDPIPPPRPADTDARPSGRTDGPAGARDEAPCPEAGAPDASGGRRVPSGRPPDLVTAPADRRFRTGRY